MHKILHLLHLYLYILPQYSKFHYVKNPRIGHLRTFKLSVCNGYEIFEIIIRLLKFRADSISSINENYANTYLTTEKTFTEIQNDKSALCLNKIIIWFKFHQFYLISRKETYTTLHPFGHSPHHLYQEWLGLKANDYLPLALNYLLNNIFIVLILRDVSNVLRYLPSCSIRHLAVWAMARMTTIVLAFKMQTILVKYEIG